MNSRRKFIWVALALTFAATAWAYSSGPNQQVLSVAASPKRSDRQLSHSTPVIIEPEIQGRGLREKLDEVGEVNLFGNEVRATYQQIEQQSLEAQIPANPFIYAGKLEEDGHYIVFLIKDGMNYAVKAGDVIDKWQVKSIKPPYMVLSFRPMKVDVPMTIGEIN